MYDDRQFSEKENGPYLRLPPMSCSGRTAPSQVRCAFSNQNRTVRADSMTIQFLPQQKENVFLGAVVMLPSFRCCHREGSCPRVIPADPAQEGCTPPGRLGGQEAGASPGTRSHRTPSAWRLLNPCFSKGGLRASNKGLACEPVSITYEPVSISDLSLPQICRSKPAS